MASADQGCIPNNQAGMVPRNARQGDNVCVPPNIAKTVQDENAAAAKGVGYVPGGGAYGPKTCTSGLVWREAFDGDGVCVSPPRRQETWQENANAGVGNTGGLKPQPGFNPGGAPAAQGSGGPDAALLAAVNDARVNPAKYPPDPTDPNTGKPWDTSGASTKACPKPFADSGALDNTAATHNGFIATMDGSLVNQDHNMHKTASGGLAYDQGGPITQAGYANTGEIVAIGQSSEAAALKFWMQDDGGANNWGHRNLILNCGLTDAGAAHFVGGPDRHYWTVDMGSH
ncbi:CAP domain-containing protein [Mycobacterium seoulense]|uniref:CAP domain-containing protein n=1 Tax=Mycobacterium seoulense TaxID=386911 RepID=UPI003CEFE970